MNTMHERVAEALLAALDGRRPLAPVSDADPDFTVPGAYRVASLIRQAREARGERVVGRKIGFTNRTIWEEYGVRAPIWGYVYDSTLCELAGGSDRLDLAPFVEPRIEPEIAFGLNRAPEPGMDDEVLLGCIGWAAHGFEIVQSHFPGWRFQAADTVAAFGLHGALLLGPRVPISSRAPGEWLESLGRFRMVLLTNGIEAARGQASDVLGGGPLTALRHIVEVLAADPDSPPLAAGEIVTTGTVTKALPVKPGEVWTTQVEGLPVPAIRLTLDCSQNG
jgi:2-oxo-3-hexenedioate decarboxylase